MMTDERLKELIPDIEGLHVTNVRYSDAYFYKAYETSEVEQQGENLRKAVKALMTFADEACENPYDCKCAYCNLVITIEQITGKKYSEI
jgi:hypothetical protein